MHGVGFIVVMMAHVREPKKGNGWCRAVKVLGEVNAMLE